jgi:hypothetical protein
MQHFKNSSLHKASFNWTQTATTKQKPFHTAFRKPLYS